jgi:hypothetical protein
VELVPGDRVRNAAVRVSDNFVEADDAGRGGTLHELRNVTIHVVINMVVIPRGDTLTGGVENTGVDRVCDGDSKGGSLLECGWGFKADGG